MKKWLPILILWAGVLGAISFSFKAEAQIDCVSPRSTSVGKIQGRVYDPDGQAIPEALVSLDSDGVNSMSVKTDVYGKFRIKSGPGLHHLTVKMPGFEMAAGNLNVGRDISNSFHPNTLYVILGLSGLTCPWITTKKHEFLGEIHANKKRFQEAVKKNATQK